MREPEHQTWKNMTAEESAQRASAEARDESIARAKAMAPETRASLATLHPALANAETFCALLARASLAKLTQDGSAFRYHPKFYITERLVLVNEWRRDDCAIYVIPKGVTLTAPPENDPRSEFSSAWPEFSGRRGASLLLRVWKSGRWEHEGPWQQDADEVLRRLEAAIAAARSAAQQGHMAKQTEQAQQAQERVVAAQSAYQIRSDVGGAAEGDTPRLSPLYREQIAAIRAQCNRMVLRPEVEVLRDLNTLVDIAELLAERVDVLTAREAAMIEALPLTRFSGGARLDEMVVAVCGWLREVKPELWEVRRG